MKLGEVVVHIEYYNFNKFHQNQMKNKKVLLIARFSVQNFKESVESWTLYIVQWPRNYLWTVVVGANLYLLFLLDIKKISFNFSNNIYYLFSFFKFWIGTTRFTNGKKTHRHIYLALFLLKFFFVVFFQKVISIRTTLA